MAKQRKHKVSAYDIITSRILQLLEKGVVPWRRPWTGSSAPANFISKRAYNGINVWMLFGQGYVSPYWLTFKQANNLGARIKKGEHGTPIVFVKRLEVEDREHEGETKIVSMIRYYKVWNVEQCTGIPEDKIPENKDTRELNPIPAAEKIVANMPKRPTVEHKAQRACYNRLTDVVNMPRQDTFEGDEEYYSVLFHEFSHSTGHEKRLGRHAKDAAVVFGAKDYSFEELVAEMSAAFLCGTAGIVQKTIENSAAYIKSWMKAFKSDNRMLVRAAAKAQAAADYILDKKGGE